MYKYVLIHTTIDRNLVNKVSDLLEQEGIPVMVDHIQIKAHTDSAHGFRILVPVQYSQTALRLLQVLLDQDQTQAVAS